MQQEDFHLQWERDDKFHLVEKVVSHDDESTWMEAIALYKEALKNQPNNPEYLHAYGYLLEIKANRLLREANACYQQGLESLRTQPNYNWIQGKLHAQFIRTHAQLLQNHQSIAYYKQLLAASPQNPDTYCYLLQCYLQSDQIHEAHKVAEAGMKLFSNHAMLIYYAGEVQARLGNTVGALDAWESSATLDPQFIDGRYSRAFLFEREHRLEEAAEEWRRIILFLDRYNFREDYPRQELQRIEELLGQ